MKHPGDLRRHPRAGTFDFVDGAWLNKQLKRSRKGTAVDLFGWDMKEMWAGVQEDQQLLDQAARVFFRPIAEGYCTEIFWQEDDWLRSPSFLNLESDQYA